MSQSTSPYHTSVFAELRRAITNVAVLHNEPPTIARRRRVVVAITLVLGAAVLGYSLRRHPGESSFYWLTLGLAAVWTVGALSSGPLHLGGICWRGRNQRPVITGTTVGLLLGGAFVVGGLIAREIPAVSALITRVLLFAHHGWLPLVVAITVINGIAEELFFRGALVHRAGPVSPGADLDPAVHGRDHGRRQPDARIRRGHPRYGVCAGTPGQRGRAGPGSDALRVGPDHGAGPAARVRALTNPLRRCGATGFSDR